MIEKNYEIVTNIISFSKMIKHIDSFDYFSFDTETTGLNVRKDKVIGLSISGTPGTAFYLPRLTWDSSKNTLVQSCSESEFVHVLNLLSKKDLLMWNASFDIRVVKSNFGIDLTHSLLADVMLMKHTVDEEGDFGLKKVAISLQSELGLNVEEEANVEQIQLKANVEKNGGSTTKTNYEMYKADLDVMGMYAAADADLTLRLGQYFQKKLEDEGLDEFFYEKEVMPLYKWVTITMEENGVQLDLPLIEKTKESIEIDMKSLEKDILEDLNSLPEVQKWLRDRALLSHYPSNTGSFAQAFCAHYNLPLPKTPSGKYSISSKTVSSLPSGPEKDFLLNGMDEYSKKLSESPVGVELGVLPLHDISWELYCKNGSHIINISSKQQMGQIAFDCLGIKPLGETKTGKPQFDDSMIQSLADDHKFSWAIKLSNYNKLVKILGTYIERFLDAQEDGYYYFSYKQHGTISGRYSGDAQQLPRPKEEGELDEIVLKYVNAIRSFFISGKDRIFIDCDYESLEPHVFSHVSGDEKLRNIFRKGHDFYSTIAIATEGLEGFSPDKLAPNYMGKLNKPLRQKAKAYALGIPYGMSGYALGMTLGISTDDAEALVDGYLSGFPDLSNWMETSRELIKHTGKISSEAGRIRHLPKAKELYIKHKDNLLEFKYRQRLEWKLVAQGVSKFEAKKMVTDAYKDYKNSLNNCLNFQIQSLGASIVNQSAVSIQKEFSRLKLDAWICMNCHDQIIVNCHYSIKDQCRDIIKDRMENTIKLSVDLKAPPMYSVNFKDGH